jgi:CheY-like chemotaxis protein
MQNTPHILIVDDDLEIRKLLGRYLTDQGYRVSLASDRRTMEDALLINEVSLIVLDVLLPDGSGERVRALGGTFSFRRIGAETVVSCTIPAKQVGDSYKPS